MKLAVLRLAFPALLSAALALPACGGSDPAGGDDDDQQIDPNGENHTFVVDKVELPDSNNAQALGLDIDGDNKVDNNLGSVLGAVSAFVDLQGPLDDVINQGKLTLLTNVKATDLTAAQGVGFSVFLGTDQMTPAACADANDTACRLQFAGTGMFNVDPAGPANATLAGAITGGKFTGGPGDVEITIQLAGSALSLPLHKARVQVTGLSASGWASSGGRIAGAITEDDIHTKVIPVVGDAVRSLFEKDCQVGSAAANCACATNSTGANLKNLFDKSPADCMISDAEIEGVFSAFLTPDIDVNDDGTDDAVSLGIGVGAVAGTFTVP